MACIIWASSVARTPVDELPGPMPGSSAEQNDIDEEEKERIRSIQLDDSESDQDVNEDAEQSFATQDSEVPVSDDDDDSNANSTYLGTLEKTMEKISTSKRTAASETEAQATRDDWSRREAFQRRMR